MEESSLGVNTVIRIVNTKPYGYIRPYVGLVKGFLSQDTLLVSIYHAEWAIPSPQTTSEVTRRLPFFCGYIHKNDITRVPPESPLVEECIMHNWLDSEEFRGYPYELVITFHHLIDQYGVKHLLDQKLNEHERTRWFKWYENHLVR